jgi:phosphomannomutase
MRLAIWTFFRNFVAHRINRQMTLIKSISGIRGTIGGTPGEGLTPIDTVRFASAYGEWLKRRFPGKRLRVVTGRDARISGPVVSDLVKSSLISLGIDVTDIGLATTPTTEIAVTGLKADGGIIITASHNPAQWNALKLLNEKGEFLSDSDGKELLQLANNDDFTYCDVYELGTVTVDDTWNKKHIDLILNCEYVNIPAIKASGFTVVADCVNSVGGLVVPELLTRLGVKRVVPLYCDPDGRFPHNPEPLPENLKELSETVVREGADLGLSVDPDVDRLALVCENGDMFGEEYTLVAVSDYVLGLAPGNTVSNMSSSKALSDVTVSHGGKYFSSPVGEVNVVAEMKRCNAVIGGEGNGGVIVPSLHYGRDALAGIALFLSHLAVKGLSVTELKQTYPQYVISKNKVELDSGMNIAEIYSRLKERYSDREIDCRDGIKIMTDTGWVHLRSSNTEPIVRIYSEAPTKVEADRNANEIKEFVKKI